MEDRRDRGHRARSEWCLFHCSRGFGIDDVALSWKFLAGNVLSISRQGGFANIIAGGAAWVIRVDRRVRVHWRLLK